MDTTLAENRQQDAAALPAAVHPVAPLPVADLFPAMDLLRFSTAGSVDDGKSTLIGRLLFDTKSIFEDQLQALAAASRRHGDDGINLALLTDGLRAEREQNITIDVAYRYFATPRRKFIIADTPGHAQYTRNMVTGASSADLALILVDARKGLLTQSRRHAFISSLLGIRHFLIAVNKMDLVDFSESVFRRISDEFTSFARKLEVNDLVFIPVSALHGDNVVERSQRMPWYQGSTLLHHLETVNVAVDRNLLDFRLPVQYVLRPHQDYRGFAGQIVSGVIRVGDEVLALPSGQISQVRSLRQGAETVPEAQAGDSVALEISAELDISRGDMIVRRNNLPIVGTRFDAMLCWLSDVPSDPAQAYILRHTTRVAPAYLSEIEYRMDVDTLHRQTADRLEVNDIGRVKITSAQPVFFDPFDHNPATGSFVLIDPFTHMTVAAGMIRSESRAIDPPGPPSHPESFASGAVWQPWNISRRQREARNRHQACVLWFTGLSGSGKSTLARALESRLSARGCQTMLLDGDQLRHGLCSDLGFSPADRMENIRRAGEVARLFFEHGNLVLCTFVSPFRRDRDRIRELIGADRFFEIFVDCPLEVCRQRDTKGLYARAAAGQIRNLTGMGQEYEPPLQPALVLPTAESTPEVLVEKFMQWLEDQNIFNV